MGYTVTDGDDEDREQFEAWEVLHERISEVMHAFGTEDHLGDGDYLIVDDNYGWRRHSIEVHRLHILRPEIVAQVQNLLDDYPDWEIVMAVDVPGTETSWPRMGITIHKHEIIDDLQRQYLPEEYRAFSYPGSRPGNSRNAV